MQVLDILSGKLYTTDCFQGKGGMDSISTSSPRNHGRGLQNQAVSEAQIDICHHMLGSQPPLQLPRNTTTHSPVPSSSLHSSAHHNTRPRPLSTPTQVQHSHLEPSPSDQSHRHPQDCKTLPSPRDSTSTTAVPPEPTNRWQHLNPLSRSPRLPQNPNQNQKPSQTHRTPPPSLSSLTTIFQTNANLARYSGRRRGRRSLRVQSCTHQLTVFFLQTWLSLLLLLLLSLLQSLSLIPLSSRTSLPLLDFPRLLRASRSVGRSILPLPQVRQQKSLLSSLLPSSPPPLLPSYPSFPPPPTHHTQNTTHTPTPPNKTHPYTDPQAKPNSPYPHTYTKETPPLVPSHPPRPRIQRASTSRGTRSAIPALRRSGSGRGGGAGCGRGCILSGPSWSCIRVCI